LIRVVLLILPVLVLLGGVEAASAVQPQRNFATHLVGDQEVPPVDTRAQGQAIFHLSKDGDSINYRLIVANIENVVQAHIHVGAVGVNGPVVVFLYGPAPIEGRFNGVLATGTITADDLIGPLAGMTLDDLLEEMSTGNAYVNVHTTQNPGGEVRGQFR